MIVVALRANVAVTEISERLVSFQLGAVAVPFLVFVRVDTTNFPTRFPQHEIRGKPCHLAEPPGDVCKSELLVRLPEPI